MPNLTIEYHQQCKSISDNIKKIGKYTVCTEYGKEWCDCPDFYFRKRKSGLFCKHIKDALENECGWHKCYSSETQTDYQQTHYICPRCGGETEVIKVAV